MDSSYTWHSGSRVVTPVWVRSPALMPDEILSSWLVRASLEQGCDPLVLTGSLWPKWRVWTLDIDRQLETDRQASLAKVSGLSIEQLTAATLKPIISRIARSELHDQASWPWVLSLGSRNHKRRMGIQYCPLCLADDPKPYYRIQWRMAWHCFCDQHDCVLHDRCWYCMAPIEPHRLLAEDSDLAVCASCKTDLRLAPVQLPLSANVYLFQQTADKAFHEGSASALGLSMSTKEWFDIANFFVSFIRRINRRKTRYGCMDRFLETTSLALPTDWFLMPGEGLGELSLSDRQMMLAMVWHLMSFDQSEFTASLLESGVSWQGLCEKGQHVPPIIAELAQCLQKKEYKERDIRNQSPPKPRSRQEVMRMMIRLQRKLDRLKR